MDWRMWGVSAFGKETVSTGTAKTPPPMSHIQTSKRHRSPNYCAISSEPNCGQILSWGHLCPPLGHLTCPSKAFAGCRASLEKKALYKGASCPRQRGSQHPISLRKLGLPCPSLHPRSYMGPFSPAKPGPWPDLPPHTPLPDQVLPSYPSQTPSL